MVMVERIARAIYEAAPERFLTGGPDRPAVPWDAAGEDTRSMFRDLGRAAIRPLRDDPDYALSQAGGETMRQLVKRIPETPFANLAWHALSAMMETAILEPRPEGVANALGQTNAQIIRLLEEAHESLMMAAQNAVPEADKHRARAEFYRPNGDGPYNLQQLANDLRANLSNMR